MPTPTKTFNGLRECCDCKQVKPVSEFNKRGDRAAGVRGYCKPCGGVRAKLTQGPRSRRSGIKKYGLTETDYAGLVDAQDGVCAICNKPCALGRLSIDHCHQTGVVRGLLCRKCNTAIGLLADSPRKLSRAQLYLARQLHPSTDKESTDNGGADLRLRGGRLPSGGK